MKPPSPWTGSITTAATLSAPTWAVIISAARAAAALPAQAAVAEWVRHRGPVDLALANGPNPCLYGMFLAVMAIARLVRPW